MAENRTEFLKECISDTIIELMKEKPLDKITVYEISRRSGVGRATYFRHFKSKEEAVIYKRRVLWERYCEKHNIVVKTKFYLGNAPLFFKFIYENRETAQLLYSTGHKDLLFDYYRSVAENPSHSSNERYREKFLLFGLMGLTDEWLITDFKETPEQMCKRLDTIVNTIGSMEFPDR